VDVSESVTYLQSGAGIAQ